MRKSHSSNNGFSLTEVLLAVGIITVGMLFIAGVFPVGIHFTTIASERTIAAVVADEAFAKVRLYAIADPCSLLDDINFSQLRVDQLVDFNNIANINPFEFAYPSDPNMDFLLKQFYWSALCRRVDPDPNSRLVQVTVFVSRKVGSGSRFRRRDLFAPPSFTIVPGPVPVPVWINVSQPVGFNPSTLLVSDADPADGISEITFINDGYTIVDNVTGQIYRVLERDAAMPDMIVLDRPWQGGPTGSVWVVPPPVGGGRYPCIAIYQRVIRF
ncbi:MAG: prepilin-type N-terminal cleavage/methylation domain-containing protein [Planctomycetes bacterium]|nr:prepilin-type N-terminal cleavage/methylation domain-containing protein [Planctomycetota bacterium]